MGNNQQVVCESCNEQTMSVTKMKGTMLINIVLLVCMVVPGVLYFVWRLTTKHKACGSCGSDQILPINSLKGKKLLKELSEV